MKHERVKTQFELIEANQLTIPNRIDFNASTEKRYKKNAN